MKREGQTLLSLLLLLAVAAPLSLGSLKERVPLKEAKEMWDGLVASLPPFEDLQKHKTQVSALAPAVKKEELGTGWFSFDCSDAGQWSAIESSL